MVGECRRNVKSLQARRRVIHIHCGPLSAPASGFWCLAQSLTPPLGTAQTIHSNAANLAAWPASLAWIGIRRISEVTFIGLRPQGVKRSDIQLHNWCTRL